MSGLTGTASSNRVERVTYWTLLAATALNCLFQSLWFWPISIHRISVDGINYIGLARNLADGNFQSSLHGYWSPLVTWWIAGASIISKNFTVVGKAVTLGSFLICLPLLYLLTLRLWQSPTASALSVFWFSTCRGVLASAAGAVLADFLLTACVLAYFVLLLQALRTNRLSVWIALGGMQALAFLAKAIAMPWLLIPTLLALVVANVKAPRRLVAGLACAALLPALIWAGWGFTQRTKYGAFTTGYQLRRNLMVNWNRSQTGYPRGNPLTYQDTSSLYDRYMVSQDPFSEMQAFQLRNPKLLTMLLRAEMHNLPAALKEIAILLTPAGALAVIAILALLIWRRQEFPAQTDFVVITLIASCALTAAYCLLVFDGRYVVPVIPLLISISCPLLLPSTMAGNAPTLVPGLRTALIGLFVACTIFFSVYWASPFRTEDRDFALSCFRGATVLHNKLPAGTMVSLGEGPYPEHGVGFEAGTYLAYLSGWRLVGQNSALPQSSTQADGLVDLAVASRPDAIAVWGKPADEAYSHILTKLQTTGSSGDTTKLLDPYKGEVGTLILLDNRSTR